MALGFAAGQAHSTTSRERARTTAPYRRHRRNGTPARATHEVMTKTLAALLSLDVVLSILVTPAGGMDPRAPAGAHGYSWVAVGLFGLGALASIAAVVQLLRNRPAGMFARGPALFFPVIVLDRLGLFHSEAAPPAIVTLEWTVAAVSILVLGLGMMGKSRLDGAARA